MPAVNTMLLLFSTKNTENLPKFFRPQYVVFSERQKPQTKPKKFSTVVKKAKFRRKNRQKQNFTATNFSHFFTRLPFREIAARHKLRF